MRPSLKADSPPTLAAFMTAVRAPPSRLARSRKEADLRPYSARQTLAFLSGPETVNHTGAVRMVWDMHRLSSRTALDITLFRDLASPSTQSKLHALAALGVLWRHDGELPALRRAHCSGLLTLSRPVSHQTRPTLARRSRRRRSLPSSTRCRPRTSPCAERARAGCASTSRAPCSASARLLPVGHAAGR